MLVYGGYLLTESQFTSIGKLRALNISGDKLWILTQFLESKGMQGVTTEAVEYPRRTCHSPGTNGILIKTREEYQDVDLVRDCISLVESEADWKTKKLLTRHCRISDAPFVTIPDPDFELEDPCDCDNSRRH